MATRLQLYIYKFKIAEYYEILKQNVGFYRS